MKRVRKKKRLLVVARSRKLTALRGCFFAYLGEVVEGVHELGGRIYAMDVHAIGDVE